MQIKYLSDRNRKKFKEKKLKTWIIITNRAGR